ncbi:MAG: ATP-binding protein [Sulfurimonadaceae bacterium]|nr:ATP-binding protein [Sulfurimonadaceae bacterium]
MREKIGTLKNTIADLELEPRFLTRNTLILAEDGSGKTNLANKIRKYVMKNGIPTIYFDFTDADVEDVEARFKDEGFFYMRFEESDTFNSALQEAIAAKKDIYMSVNTKYFSNKRDVKSSVSKMLQTRELLDNYYYLFQETSHLNAFYTQFEDFLLYTLNLVNLKKYGLTFLSQPHETFEDPQIKLIFTFLFIGKCSNANYFNTAILRNMKPNTFYFQYRMDHKTLLFNAIRGDIATIDT